MTQIILWIVFLLLIVFIYKVGSFLWRTFGVLILIFLIWVFRHDIYYQAQQLVEHFHWNQLSGYFAKAGQFFQGLWQSISHWITDKMA